MQTTKDAGGARRLGGVLNPGTMEKNAGGVTISNATMELIRCRARLADIYAAVSEVLAGIYIGTAVDREMAAFSNAFSTMTDELQGFISESIAARLLDSDFREM